MNKIYDKVKECYKQVNEMTEFKPQIALVLGSGLGDYAEKIKIEAVIDYHEIKGFPVSTVQGHKGRFVLGYVEDIPVMIMEGRVHYYEGYSMSDVVLPIRLMKMMGAEILFLTNASGGIHRGFEAGDFMMITDQIASFVPSPLIGPNIEEFGERFPDMSHIYDEELQEVIRKSADHNVPFAMLLKSQYWHAAKRVALFSDIRPAYVLPLTWRPDFLLEARGGSPLMEVHWCVWMQGSSKTEYIPLIKPRK